MVDPGAKVLYKARFDIKRRDAAELLVDSFFEDVMNWMKAKFRRTKH